MTSQRRASNEALASTSPDGDLISKESESKYATFQVFCATVIQQLVDIMSSSQISSVVFVQRVEVDVAPMSFLGGPARLPW